MGAAGVSERPIPLHKQLHVSIQRKITIDLTGVKFHGIAGNLVFRGPASVVPSNHTTLESLSLTASGLVGLRGLGVSQNASFEAHGRPFVPNGAEHVMGTRGRRPID